MAVGAGSFVQVWLEEALQRHLESKPLELIKDATNGNSLDESQLLKKLLDYATTRIKDGERV